MKKEFVPYELAVKLKALGFEESCLAGFDDDGDLHIQRVDFQSDIEGFCLAPTFSQAFRWFRENGKVAEVFSQILPSNKYKWGYKIQGVEGITDGFLTYEEAELACLEKLIEIVLGKSE